MSQFSMRSTQGRAAVVRCRGDSALWFFRAAGRASGPAALNFGRATLLHDVMVRRGDGAKRLWATAFGWNTLPANWTGQHSPWGQVDEAAQTQYTGQAAELASTRWPWLGPLFWPAVCPQLPSDDPWRGFTLCAADGSAKPVANALAVAAKPPTVLPPGDHAVDHPALRYDPGWRVTSAAADPGADGDALTYDFVGTETALRVQGGPFWAYYLVSVDGQPANALPTRRVGRELSCALRSVERGAADSAGSGSRARTASGAPEGARRLGAVGVARHPGGRWHGGRFQTAGLADPVLVCSVRGWDLPRSGVAGARSGALWLAARLDATARWPDAAWLGAAALLALLLGLSRWPIVDLVALAALGLIFFIRPDVALPLIAFSIPFWPRPKALVGLEFSLYELLLWLAVRGRSARAGWCRGQPKLRRGDCASGYTVSTGRFSRFSPLVSRRRWQPSDRTWPCVSSAPCS